MARAIWKFELVPGQQLIDMPRGAEPLFVDRQRDSAFVWCAVDPSAPTIRHGFTVVGTGHQLPEDGRYIGSWQFRDEGLVFHAFDHYEDPLAGGTDTGGSDGD